MAFGSSPFTFGSANANNQQQQQQPSTGFGGFGANTGAGGFGQSTTPAFGQPAQQANTGIFGGAAPSNPFGASTSTPAFGATNTGGGFGSTTGGFGSTNNAAPTSTFSFGAPQQQTQPQQPSLFGGGGGGFGTGGFGGFGANNAGPTNDIAQINDTKNPRPRAYEAHANLPAGQKGTATAPARPGNPNKVLMWKDDRSNGTVTDNKAKISNGTTKQGVEAIESSNFDNICGLPMFWYVSPEELRLEDYSENRKTAPAQTTGGFGSGFGTGQTTSTGFGNNTSAFGGGSGTTGGFGQPASTSTGGFGGFGAAAAKPAGSGFGGFGQPAAPATTGGFGSTTTGFGAQQNKPSPFGGSTTFGQPAQTNTTSTFGGFGQNNNTNTGTSTFGGFGQQNNNTNTTAPSTFSFGQPAAKPSLFGGAPSTDTKAPFSFGAPSTNTTTPSLFGQQPQQQQQQPTTNLFGGGNTGASNPFGSTTTSNTFGQPQQQSGTGAAAPFSFGAKPATTGGFGSTTGTGTGSTGFGGFGGFGSNQNNQQQNTQQQQGATGFGGFGQQNNTTNNTGAAAPFGSTGTSGAAPFSFGSNTNTQQNQSQQPQSTGFGSTLGGGSNLFGGFGANQNNNNNATANTGATGFGGGSTLFGSGGFGAGLSTNNQQQNQNQNQQQLQLQQSQLALQTSIDQNPYGNNPLFATLANSQAPGGGPKAVDSVPENSAKKQPALTLSYRASPRSPVKLNKLRGFASGAASPASGLNGSANARFGSPAPNRSASALSNSSLFRSSTASPTMNALNLSNGLNDGLVLSPQAFVARPSVKKLVIDRSKHTGKDSDFLFNRSKTAPPTSNADGTSTPGGQKLSFNPLAEIADRPGRGGVSNSASAGSLRALTANPASGTATPTSGPGAKPSKQEELPVRKGDYYSKPSMRVLLGMSPQQLSEVHNLVVGRADYGSICWHEPVDLTTLDNLEEQLFGDVVLIEDREAIVYPDHYEDSKPPVGEGLNVPAEISLHGCWPLDKATRKPITDAENPRVTQHIKKLKKRDETEFVDFDVKSGTWTFKVQHFSRYGLDDSDDEDEDEVEPDNRKKQKSDSPAVMRKKAVQARSADHARRVASPSSDETMEDDEDEAPPRATLDDDDEDGDEDEAMSDEGADKSQSRRQRESATPANRSDTFEEEDDDDDQSTERGQSDEEDGRRRKRSVVVPTPRFAPGSKLHDLESPVKGGQSRLTALGQMSAPRSGPQPIPQRLGLEPKKLAVMQASFFSKPKESSAPAPAIKAKAPFRNSANQPAAMQEHSTENTQLALPEPEQVFPVYRPLRTWQDIPLSKSQQCSREGQVVDAGLMMGRSFRASFGPEGQLVHLGRLATVGAKEQASKFNVVHLTRPAFLPGSESSQAASATDLLEIQLAHTAIIDTGDNSAPLATTQGDIRFHHFASKFDASESSQEANLWRLGHALFDEIDLRLPENISAEVATRVQHIRRRDAFSEWLKSAVASAVEENLRELADTTTSNSAAVVFALLTGHQIERACQSALSNGDIRLSTLLAQIGGDEDFRADVDLQLAKWREYRVDPHIAKDYRKVYELLSGNVDVSAGIQAQGSVDSSQEIKLGEGLDWKRAFALRFWYEHSDTNVSQSLADYQSAMSAHSDLAKPLPEHELVQEELRWRLPDSGKIQDVLYELIQVYSNPNTSLESVLSPRSSTTSPFDYRQSWHLYQLLSQSLQVRDFEDADEMGYSADGEVLICNYADQLEKIGLWQWAAFVYLHLSSQSFRDKAIKELLARHLLDFTAEHTEFLQNTLQIPATFLDDVRDIYSLEEEQ